MKKIISINEEEICFILDNCSIHWSREVKMCFANTDWAWVYLPQYTPEMAPVELFFGQLKRLISTRRNLGIVDLMKNKGRKVLIDSIISIDEVAISKIWLHFTSKLKEWIGELDSIIDQNI